LRRRPEILLRLQPDDPQRLAALAEQIVRRAASRVKPGGRLVFSVCSVLHEECEAVVQRVSDVLAPVPFDAPEVTTLFGSSATAFRLLTGTHGTDGYFAASLRRCS
jgi:16S rRNA (cytosine967-C5)-methyltransferase